ncbi:MAG TPA: hemolysin family protein [Gemmatimonadaceae bacterium]|nr:hemolysin family protein [Gemmatimonadaceae bacterium]
MSELSAWILGIVAAGAATLFATADSALLAFHAAESSALDSAVVIERERRHRALSMARVLAYIVAGAAFAQALALETFGMWSRVLAIAVVTLVVCTLCEGVARAIGHADPMSIHARLMGVTRTVGWLLRPAVALGAALERALAVIIPESEREAEREASTEQFREVVAAEADVSSAEEELIHGVFSLGETEVQEIMVPRVDIVGIDDVTPWSEVLDRIRSSEHARFPVFHETLDEVTGILYAKDVLPSIITDEEPEAGWLSLARPPAFIPISKRIDTQLREFQATRTHIAIVSDEYGGTAGLITIEDILEEIVGEIRDEYDVEEPEIQQEGNRCYWVSGRVPLDDLRERLNWEFDLEDVTTVGGLVYSMFGRVPRAGESMTFTGFRIVVERVRRRRIERVYFERLLPAEKGAKGGDDEERG